MDSMSKNSEEFYCQIKNSYLKLSKVYNFAAIFSCLIMLLAKIIRVFAVCLIVFFLIILNSLLLAIVI